MKQKQADRLIYNPQFWSVIIIFVLITLHHYDDQSSFRIFNLPDLPLGLTRHTIDRILFLVPIILSSFIFGTRGGKITVISALVVMLPRALFISPSTSTALWETFTVTLIGSLAPFGLELYKRQEEQLIEKLESTQMELHSTVQLSREQEKQLNVINAFSKMLSESLEVGQMMRAAIEMVMEVVQAEVVMMFALDDRSDSLKLIAYKGITSQSARALDGIKVGEGLCGRVAETGEPITVDDAQESPRFCTMPVKEERLKAELSVPMTARGEIVGTICVATRTEHRFKEAEIKLLSALGSLIGLALDNSVLYEEKVRTTDQLRISEKRYRQLFENAHDAIWVQDMSGRVTGANEAAAELFGYELNDLINMDSKRFFDQDDFDISKLMEQNLLSGHGMQEPFRETIVKKDGSRAVVMLTANLISSDGLVSGIQFIGRDITKEVRMRENQSFYLKQITRAHEEERLRISRDLHDSTAQNLIALLRQLEKFVEEDTYLPEERQEFLWKFYGRLKESLQEIRQLSRDLRPSVIDDLGLLAAVEWLVRQLASEYQIDAKFTVAGEERRFTPELEVTLFRIVQEALRNIARHAEATEVKVTVDFQPCETKVVIVDNGKGFEVPTSTGEFSRLGKLGIDGMQTRARLAGGTLDIKSDPGQGTTITVTIPA